VAKTTAVCVKFFPDVACQKLLKSANVSRSYTKNKSGTFFMDNGVQSLDAFYSLYLIRLRLQAVITLQTLWWEIGGWSRSLLLLKHLWICTASETCFYCILLWYFIVLTVSRFSSYFYWQLHALEF